MSALLHKVENDYSLKMSRNDGNQSHTPNKCCIVCHQVNVENGFEIVDYTDSIANYFSDMMPVTVISSKRGMGGDSGGKRQKVGKSVEKVQEAPKPATESKNAKRKR